MSADCPGDQLKVSEIEKKAVISFIQKIVEEQYDVITTLNVQELHVCCLLQPLQWVPVLQVVFV